MGLVAVERSWSRAVCVAVDLASRSMMCVARAGAWLVAGSSAGRRYPRPTTSAPDRPAVSVRRRSTCNARSLRSASHARPRCPPTEQTSVLGVPRGDLSFLTYRTGQERFIPERMKIARFLARSAPDGVVLSDSAGQGSPPVEQRLPHAEPPVSSDEPRIARAICSKPCCGLWQSAQQRDATSKSCHHAAICPIQLVAGEIHRRPPMRAACERPLESTDLALTY
jgi:hypothetical protein